MPVYEYRCTACEKIFEYQQRMVDPPMTVCEACGGALERLISRTAFQLKGGGWYKDLYASTKPEAGTSTTSTEAKDAKPAASDGGASAPASTPSAAPSSGSGSGSGGGSGGGGGTGGSGSGGGSTPASGAA